MKVNKTLFEFYKSHMRLNAVALGALLVASGANAAIFASYLDPASESNLNALENTYSRLYTAYPYSIYKDTLNCPGGSGLAYNNFDPNYATRRSGCGDLNAAIASLTVDLERAAQLYPSLSLVQAIDATSATSVRGGLINYNTPFKWKKNVPRPDASCSKTAPVTVGNPIVVATGNKIQTEVIMPRVSNDSLYRLTTTYISMGSNYSILGMKWSSDFSSKLSADTTMSQGAIDNGRINYLYAARDDGSAFEFKKSGTLWISDAPHRTALRYSAGYYYLTDFDLNLIDKFDANGALVGRYKIGGEYAVITRSSTQFSVSTAYGRSFSFAIGSDGSASSFSDASGNNIFFAWSTSTPKMLTSVTFQDGSKKTYGYNDSRNRTLLTDLTDELGTAQAHWTYDMLGRATGSEHYGGVEKNSIDFSSQISPVITLPSGDISKGSFASAAGLALNTSKSQPAGSGCSASVSSATYDANNTITSTTDFIGAKSCFLHDGTRQTEMFRLEGLLSTDSCPADLSTYQIPATLPSDRPQRKISTLWHPDWRLKTRQAEPNLITTWVYNGQPNPLNGNLIASCAPSTALLPDGRPIAVLCAKISQATTDSTGSSGFSAAQLAGSFNQQESWTYNQYGQMLTYDGPRTDVNDISKYAYYSDTSSDHTIGDLKSITNPLGQMINYIKYNKHGQPLTMVDANGITTNYVYDARLRLVSSSTGGQLTSYEYNAAGLIKKLTKPDGSYLAYDYDGAQRLISVYDNLGNRVTYTLDNLGKVTAEKFTDPTGVLKRSLNRSFDALGRVQQVSGRE